jgi:signal transduction histidine kinase
MEPLKEIFVRHKKYWQWMRDPVWSAFLLAVFFAAILFPYWWLAVQWSYQFFADTGVRFTFIATTFLLVLILADSVFLVRYYQIVRKYEFELKVRELRQSEDALRMANNKLNLLSGITRHDIRNQLMALKAFIQLSEDSIHDPGHMAELLKKEEMIADTIERQINFTSDYEDMGVKSPVWQNVEAIANKAASELLVRDILIETNCHGLEIFADPLLGKVFFNLIDNALRYGGDTMTAIRFTVRETNGGTAIVGEDDGSGISADDKKRLFGRGFGHNTGLGLFLSREILSITGITITETGEPGKGARFEILVPEGGYRFPDKK